MTDYRESPSFLVLLRLFILTGSVLFSFPLQAQDTPAGTPSSDEQGPTNGANNEDDSQQNETNPDNAKALTRQRVSAPTSALYERWLEQQLPSAQIQWLETDTGRFLALYNPDRSGKTKGAAILLHNQGQRAGWPDTLMALHEQLAESGWHSLFITLPDPKSTPIPKRSDPHPLFAKAKATDRENPQDGSSNEETGEGAAGDSQGGETSDNTTKPSAADQPFSNIEQDEDGESPPPEAGAGAAGSDTGATDDTDDTKAEDTGKQNLSTAEQVDQRIRAAIAFLNQKGQYNIVLIGSGIGATRAANYLQQNDLMAANPSAAVQALVMIDAQNTEAGRDTEAEQNKALEEFIVELKLPVLDVLKSENEAVLQQGATRLRLIPRSQRRQYQQIRLLPSVAYDLQRQSIGVVANRGARRIRGWLDRHVSSETKTRR
jgi:hypothetical protein